jgi:hypothetical protein
MTDVAELHTQDSTLDDPPKHEVTLSTTVNGTVISISGNGGFSLPTGQAATHCKFALNDTSGANVQFSSLDTQDGIATCPPTGSGNQSGQIHGVTMNNNASPRTAQFTDSNNNQGQLNVSYQWNFTCNAPYTVQPFDPIISNGGKLQP